jgi:lauroyl/myristoyl acyltransferase
VKANKNKSKICLDAIRKYYKKNFIVVFPLKTANYSKKILDKICKEAIKYWLISVSTVKYYPDI